MARVGSTGVLQLHYVPTIDDLTGPTVAEITAATAADVTPWLTRDGLNTPRSGSTIPTAGVENRYNSTARGSFGGDPITATFFRDNDDENDDAWDTLTDVTDGYFVVARFGGSGTNDALADGDRVEVWPIEVISREMLPIVDNEPQRFTVTCAVPEPPEDDAVVGGGGS